MAVGEFTDPLDPRQLKRSPTTVDYKLCEADFFLEQLLGRPYLPPESGYLFGAFVSAARSVTFALQSVMAGVEGFRDWYSPRRAALRSDPVVRWFVSARNLNQKQGVSPISVGTVREGSVAYRFGHDEGGDAPPEHDVETAARHYVRHLAQLVFDWYRDWGPLIDPMEYYTPGNFSRLGKTIGEAEAEIMGVRGWTDVSGMSDDDRWYVLRREYGHVSSLHDLWQVFDRYGIEPD